MQGGVGAAIPYLKKRIKEAAGESKSSGRPGSRQPILSLAKLIIGAWETDLTDAAPYASDTEAEPDRAEMLRLLLAIGDGQLLERFIANVIARQYDGSENKALSACVPFLGPEKTGALLSTLVGQNMKLSYRECVDDARNRAHRVATNPGLHQDQAQV